MKNFLLIIEFHLNLKDWPDGQWLPCQQYCFSLLRKASKIFPTLELSVLLHLLNHIQHLCIFHLSREKEQLKLQHKKLQLSKFRTLIESFFLYYILDSKELHLKELYAQLDLLLVHLRNSNPKFFPCVPIKIQYLIQLDMICLRLYSNVMLHLQ